MRATRGMMPRMGRAILFLISFEVVLGTARLSVAYNMPPSFGRPTQDMNRRAVDVLKPREVVSTPVQSLWFPVSKADIDYFVHDAEDGGQLQSDHPGFQDTSYRERRRSIADKAFEYRHGQKLPIIDYTASEHETWKLVYKKLRAASKVHAVDEYNSIVSDMERSFGYGEARIPQLQDVSDYLQDKTGWTMRPAPGLLPARGFLNSLALRVFHSTQYLRHGSRPFYTPEPDIVHELIGHAPLLADPDFAALSQEIGLASLGATDEEIRRLAACYWFSVEFGLCRRGAGAPVKAYGAGVLSSLDELLHACAAPGRAPTDARGQTPAPPSAAARRSAAAALSAALSSMQGGTGGAAELREWDPLEAAGTEYPITSLQPRYYVAQSLDHAKAAMRAYCRSLPRPFAVEVDPAAGRVVTDRPVVRARPHAARQ